MRHARHPEFYGTGAGRLSVFDHARAAGGLSFLGRWSREAVQRRHGLDNARPVRLDYGLRRDTILRVLTDQNGVRGTGPHGVTTHDGRGASS